MRTGTTKRWVLCAMGVAMAAALTACGGDKVEGNAGNQPSTGEQPVEFSTFTKATFANDADSTPLEINSINFAFDANNDPTAFTALLM